MNGCRALLIKCHHALNCYPARIQPYRCSTGPIPLAYVCHTDPCVPLLPQGESAVEYLKRKEQQDTAAALLKASSIITPEVSCWCTLLLQLFDALVRAAVAAVTRHDMPPPVLWGWQQEP